MAVHADIKETPDQLHRSGVLSCCASAWDSRNDQANRLACFFVRQHNSANVYIARYTPILEQRWLTKIRRTSYVAILT